MAFRSSALAEAELFGVADQLAEFTDDNVAKAVKIPSGAAAERRVPTPTEIRQLFAAAEGDRLADAFVLAVPLGLRRGELLGLRCSNVDLDERILVVRTIIQHSGGAPRITEPKTRRSLRRIRLPHVAVTALQRQRVRQAKERLAAGPPWDDQVGVRLVGRDADRAAAPEQALRTDPGRCGAGPAASTRSPARLRDLPDRRGTSTSGR
ncbi:hypothetical protein ACVGVM_00060 [Pseudonocardia bannensis]|uniref:hypothetical protein n=1 Tax=Pseudonocardia bannensis TaxID=630973 RepID=UPI001B7CEAEB|nr:hypothetical protein [Pseudonocardia bannensis]